MTWAGVDVGGRRKGFHAAVVDGSALRAGPARLRSPADVFAWLGPLAPAVVAVDSPAVAAPAGASSRDCERRLAAAICGLRYTPDQPRLRASSYYDWILHGFELYDALARHRRIEDVEHAVLVPVEERQDRPDLLGVCNRDSGRVDLGFRTSRRLSDDAR